MATTQHLWTPIPTRVISTAAVTNSQAADSIEAFLSLHSGELPGDSNATASLVRLIQGLRSNGGAPIPIQGNIAATPKTKKRKHDKLASEGEITASSVLQEDESVAAGTQATEPAKKKKKKRKSEKNLEDGSNSAQM